MQFLREYCIGLRFVVQEHSLGAAHLQPFPNSPQQHPEHRRGHRKPLKSVAVMHPRATIPGLPAAHIAVVVVRAQQQDERLKLLPELG